MMQTRVVVRGHAGEVRWGYYIAAELGAWTLDADHLSARVVRQDAYRVQQSPLSFIVRRPSGAVWAWRLDNPTLNEGTLTARVRTEES